MKSAISLFTLSRPARHRRWLLKGISLLMLLSLVSMAAIPAWGALPREPLRSPDSPEVSPDFWTKETVESRKYFVHMTDHSLRFDNPGYPHIAYGGDHLYYASFDGTKWSSIMPDTAMGVGRYASLAFDTVNKPRISYHDYYNGALKLAYYDSITGWNTLVLDNPTNTGFCKQKKVLADVVDKTPHPSEPDTSVEAAEPEASSMPDAGPYSGVGLFTSIAVDTNNRVHISYYDANLKVLKYATWNGISCEWQIIDGDKTGNKNYDVGMFTSIAVDSTGNPRISYFDEKYDELKFAEYSSNANTWWVTAVDGDDVGGFTSLALDLYDNVHVSYYDAYNQNLKYAYHPKDSEDWEIRTVDDEGVVGWFTSIAENKSTENMCISYFDATNENLKYVCDSDWTPTVVDTLDSVGYYTSLAFDAFNVPHIAYMNLSNGEYRYTTLSNQWYYRVVDQQGGNVGLYNSVALDSTNNPSVAYFDETRSELKYARKNGAIWDVSLVASGPQVGRFASMKLTTDGQPRIAYYDEVSHILKYASWNGTAWQFQNVDTSADVGQYVSLALDTNNRAHISYFDATNGDLKYAYQGASGWQIRFVDYSAEYVGLYTSITLNSVGRPAISYYDWTHKRLKYAYNTPLDVWEWETVDETGNINSREVGLYTSLALDMWDNPHISYQTITYLYPDMSPLSYSLRYAFGVKSATNPKTHDWLLHDVDVTGKVGAYSSLAMVKKDPNRPVISYYDETNGDLKFAAAVNNSWKIWTVDALGDTGRYTSLAVTPAGEPRISYHDVTNGALRFASAPVLYWMYLPVLKNNR